MLGQRMINPWLARSCAQALKRSVLGEVVKRRRCLLFRLYSQISLFCLSSWAGSVTVRDRLTPSGEKRSSESLYIRKVCSGVSGFLVFVDSWEKTK